MKAIEESSEFSQKKLRDFCWSQGTPVYGDLLAARWLPSPSNEKVLVTSISLAREQYHASDTNTIVC